LGLSPHEVIGAVPFVSFVVVDLLPVDFFLYLSSLGAFSFFYVSRFTTQKKRIFSMSNCFPELRSSIYQQKVRKKGIQAIVLLLLNQKKIEVSFPLTVRISLQPSAITLDLALRDLFCWCRTCRFPPDEHR
jgi:hypothetical protein